ncbi:MAG TPA: hypothetical protein VGV64_05390 [Thermoplasmata archaeon]|nr:hypothetical protein [Thermoplasmata archaeon]
MPKLSEPGCPVCEIRWVPGTIFCANCGFPSSLHQDARRGLEGPDPYPQEKPVASVNRTPPRARLPEPSRESEAIGRLADELEAAAGLLRKVGGDASEIASEIRSAALNEIDGRPSEAVSTLRSAIVRTTHRTREQFERRLKEVDAREEALKKDGLAAGVEESTREIHAALAAGRLEEAIAPLDAADAEVRRLEADLRGLRAALREAEELLGALRRGGVPLPESEAQLREIRDRLGAPGPSSASLEAVTRAAEELVSDVRNRAPALLRQELDRHGGLLALYPDSHPSVGPARSLHSEAAGFLHEGQVSEASRRIEQLQRALQGIGPVPETRRTPEPEPEPEPEPTVETEAPLPEPEASAPAAPAKSVPIQNLLQMARLLASRVRSLPTDSDLSYEAAAEIRAATQLLRERRFADAEGTLTRLMQSLDRAALEEGTVPR